MGRGPRPIHVAVIGAGPGGYACAYRAADLGCVVTLIDEEANPGGVCAHRGCIPSKALLHVAQVLADAKDAEQAGVVFGSPEVDVDALRRWTSTVVRRLTEGNRRLAGARHVTYIQGRASLLGPTRLAIETGGQHRTLDADYIVLATGSSPRTLPGADAAGTRVWDSTSALALPFIPRSLLVIGGGYIGLELATVYASLGCAVTIVETGPQLLAGADRDLVEVLLPRLRSAVRTIAVNTRVRQLTDRASDVRAVLASDGHERVETFDAVLVAIGRKPNSRIDGLDRTSVRLDARGFVVVDEQRRTAEASIFAIGDVAGEPMLAHKAMHEGCVAAEVIAGERVRFAPRVIPAVVFTDPEIAWCGLTETSAASIHRPVQVTRFPWAASGRAAALGTAAGVTKLVADPVTGRILGAGIAGRGAGELIAEAVLAVEMGASVQEVARAIHPHPTLSETLMESAEMWAARATHVFRPRRSAGSQPEEALAARG